MILSALLLALTLGTSTDAPQRIVRPTRARDVVTRMARWTDGSIPLPTSQCAMCKRAVTGSEEGRRLSRSINAAILLLLAAPFTIVGTAGWWFVRRMRGSIGDGDEQPSRLQP